MFTFIPEKTKTNILLAPQTTASMAQKYVDPSAGVMAINLRAVVKMGNAADLVLSLKYADNATGTNAANFAENVPLYVNGVRQVDAKAHTITDDTGNFVVDFCVDPALVPEGKFIGIHQAASNVATLIATTAIEDSTNKPAV